MINIFVYVSTIILFWTEIILFLFGFANIFGVLISLIFMILAGMNLKYYINLILNQRK